MTEIKTLESNIVYENKWMRVKEDRIQRASGTEGIFGVVEKPDFVVIIPVSDGYVHLVEQCRRYWELPQGSWEHDPDADHVAIAAGELQFFSVSLIKCYSDPLCAFAMLGATFLNPFSEKRECLEW